LGYKIENKYGKKKWEKYPLHDSIETEKKIYIYLLRQLSRMRVHALWQSTGRAV
jgi:hypothetical protein